MANRRIKPNFSLRDIDPSIISPSPSGGAVGAGLGAGRPSLVPDPPRRPNPANFGSPFSNFSKIVFVLFSSIFYLTHIFTVTRLAHLTLPAKLCYMPKASTSQVALPLQ
jgi:hypothetical protein